MANDDEAGESPPAPAVQSASGAGAAALSQPPASELAPLSPADATQVELGFQLILDNRVLLCFLQDAIDLVRAQFPGIILEDALAIPNHRRASLDDLKDDVVFAQRQKSSLPLSDRLKDTLTFTRLCLLVVEELGIDTAWPAGRFSFNTRVFKNVFLRDEPWKLHFVWGASIPLLSVTGPIRSRSFCRLLTKGRCASMSMARACILLERRRNKLPLFMSRRNSIRRKLWRHMFACSRPI